MNYLSPPPLPRPRRGKGHGERLLGPSSILLPPAQELGDAVDLIVMTSDRKRDRNVPGRVGEHHLRPLVAEKPGVALRVQSVAAEQAMIAKCPKITRLRDRRLGLQRRQDVLFVFACRRKRHVDLAHLEAGNAKIDVAGDLQYVRELEFQRVKVPARLLAEAIECEPQ